ncbi:MAG TPA: hypothetical protein PKD61_11660 [Polyangiaceae bacterium]|nr:hypothetical protein [Polyangiaceae bacterium]
MTKTEGDRMVVLLDSPGAKYRQLLKTLDERGELSPGTLPPPRCRPPFDSLFM